jgi:hypothetical protein
MPQGTEAKYSEEELRKRMAQAFREGAKIVHTAFSYSAAYQRMIRRADEIESGGPLDPPPNHWGGSEVKKSEN